MPGRKLSMQYPTSDLISDQSLSRKNSLSQLVAVLMRSVDKKDRCTGLHLRRVVHYAIGIAKEMKLSLFESDQVALGALLHDVGKIDVLDEILKKPAPLNSEERSQMQKHPQLGFDILSRALGLDDELEALELVIAGVRHHHERWDGEGYPSRLKGTEIPKMARIIAVADAFDAMVSDRPYRAARSSEFAFQEIALHRGTQFDPEVVDAFVAAFQGLAITP